MSKSIEKLKMLIDVKTIIGIFVTVASISGSAVFLYAEMKFNNNILIEKILVINESLSELKQGQKEILSKNEIYDKDLAFMKPTLERLLNKIGF